MLVSGVLTCTMLYAAVAPQAALGHTFGSTLEGPVGEVVVRNWGVLVALVGAMLIHGAFNRAVRPLVLTVAGVSKLAFVGLLITVGWPVLGPQATVALVSDVIQVTLFLGYLIPLWRQGTAPGAGAAFRFSRYAARSAVTKRSSTSPGGLPA
jgi:hypothetical protein